MLVAVIAASISVGLAKPQLSPFQYGLKEAKTGIERYRVLYNTHVAALKMGKTVSYKGIDSLDIEIPADAKPIPLGIYNDFNHIKLYVTNNYKDVFIFEMVHPTLNPIEVNSEYLDVGNFNTNNQLRNGDYMLVLKDKKPWGANRRRYKYAHTRKDILLIKKGKALNSPISPYNNEYSEVAASYCEVTNSLKMFRNLTLFRRESNRKVANLLSVSNQYNVRIENIVIHTPADTLVDDRAISLTDCIRVKFKNVWIDDTYSKEKRSGYGIFMDNVYDSFFEDLTGYGNWGVFGTNNMSKVYFSHCDINRFDIHCYGRDVSFNNCSFRNIYNQFSAIMGEISFKKCKFINFIPVVFEVSYNAYTKFDLKMKNCTIISDNGNSYLIGAYDILNDSINPRQELNEKGWPFISVNGLKVVNKSNSHGFFYIYYLGPKDLQKYGRLRLDIESGFHVKKLSLKPEGKLSFSISNLSSF